jgi:hypothetical protein
MVIDLTSIISTCIHDEKGRVQFPMDIQPSGQDYNMYFLTLSLLGFQIQYCFLYDLWL